MSTNVSSPCNSTSCSKQSVNNINAGIDSTFRSDPSHRGSLTSSELDIIHQTKSFQTALQLEKQDNREIAAKKKQVQKPN